MARPRVFVSSTYYDLKHLRSSLETFIDRLGYEAILSEKDVIAYTPDAPLDESCYRETRSADIYVLIIGGRYGSEVSAAKSKRVEKPKFYERYESITKQEYQNALDRGIPIYICIEAPVDAEYQTFQKNRENDQIVYAHVDSINIFHLIEFIREQQKNNPIKLFSKYSEIEDWLREQWAGFFRELIHRMSQPKQLTDINTRVNDLKETMETLKRYLEEVVSKVSVGSDKGKAEDLVRSENERLKVALEDSKFATIGYVDHLNRSHRVPPGVVRKRLTAANSYKEFLEPIFEVKLPSCCASARAFDEINEARRMVDRPEFPAEELAAVKEIVKQTQGASTRSATMTVTVRSDGAKAQIPEIKKVGPPPGTPPTNTNKN
jgi:hypothetical protein